MLSVTVPPSSVASDAVPRKLGVAPVTCVKPRGALYVFPRLDPDVYKISDDQQLVIDLLEQQHDFSPPRAYIYYEKPRPIPKKKR